MRGRSGCPTGQEKNSVGATGESLSDFLQGKVGYRVAPSSDPASPAHLPPEGKALGVGASLPDYNTHPLPARPAGGRAVTGVRYRAAGQAEKKREPPQGPPDQSRESRGENLSPLALFPPVSREKRGPPPGRRPTGRCAPRPVKAPPTWRVPIISPVAFLSRAPQNTAHPPPAGRPPGQSTPRPPRLGGSSRPSPARGRRR